MELNIIPFDTLLADLQQKRSLEENLDMIVNVMEKELEFSSLGVFLKIAKSDIFRLMAGRNLSSAFSKNTIFTEGDPLIEELMKLKLLDIKYPGRYLFEKDYSHLVICPIFHHDQLLGFAFLDTESENFSKTEISKFRIFASLLSMVVALDEQNNEILQHNKIFESTSIFDPKIFYGSAEKTYSMMNRYNRYLSLAIMKLINHRSFLRNFGEKKTEEMMISISNLLQKDLRDSDIISRLNNDTIAILMPETTKKNALLTVQRINNNICKLPFMKSSSLGWGITTKTENTATFDDMLKIAEGAAIETTRKGNKTIIVI